MNRIQENMMEELRSLLGIDSDLTRKIKADQEVREAIDKLRGALDKQDKVYKQLLPAATKSDSSVKPDQAAKVQVGDEMFDVNLLAHLFRVEKAAVFSKDEEICRLASVHNQKETESSMLSEKQEQRIAEMESEIANLEVNLQLKSAQKRALEKETTELNQSKNRKVYELETKMKEMRKGLDSMIQSQAQKSDSLSKELNEMKIAYQSTSDELETLKAENNQMKRELRELSNGKQTAEDQHQNRIQRMEIASDAEAAELKFQLTQQREHFDIQTRDLTDKLSQQLSVEAENLRLQSEIQKHDDSFSYIENLLRNIEQERDDMEVLYNTENERVIALDKSYVNLSIGAIVMASLLGIVTVVLIILLLRKMRISNKNSVGQGIHVKHRKSPLHLFTSDLDGSLSREQQGSDSSWPTRQTVYDEFGLVNTWQGSEKRKIGRNKQDVHEHESGDVPEVNEKEVDVVVEVPEDDEPDAKVTKSCMGGGTAEMKKASAPIREESVSVEEKITLC